MTVEEIERVHGVPEEAAVRIYNATDGSYKTLTQLDGQGVHVPVFTEVLKRLPGKAVNVNPWSYNPMPVVPIWYGAGPLYSVLPWGRIA